MRGGKFNSYGSRHVAGGKSDQTGNAIGRLPNSVLSELLDTGLSRELRRKINKRLKKSGQKA